MGGGGQPAAGSDCNDDFLQLPVELHPCAGANHREWLPKLPSLRNVFCFFQFEKTVTYMGSFNGPTMKPLQIWHPSTQPGNGFTLLARPRPHGLGNNLASSGESWDGSHSYTGNKQLLSESEHYTPEFGACVASIFKQIRAL